MKKLYLVPLIIILVMVLVIGGCSKATTTPTAPTATGQTPTTPHKVLKIGSVQALNTVSGIEMKKWLELFAKLIKSGGGWKVGSDTYDLEVIVYDSQGDAQVAKNNLDKLVLQDGVKYIVGSPTGSPGIDTTITEPNKVICFGTDMQDLASDPSIKYYYSVFGSFARGLMYKVYTDMKNLGIKSFVSVKSDTEMGHWADQLCGSTWKLVAGDSVKNLGTVYFDPASSDFAPIATKILALKPELVDMNFSSNIVQIYTALHDVGYKGMLLPSFADPTLVANLVTKCGKEFIEGGECVGQDPRGIQKDPEMVGFINAYTAEYGEFMPDGVLNIQAWFLLRDAINRAGSVDVEAVKAALDNSKVAVRTLSGWVQLFARPDKGNLRTIHSNAADYVARITDGKLQTIQETSVKDHYLSSILSYGWVDIYKAYWDQYGYPTFPAGQTSTIKYSDLGIMGHD